MLTIGKIAGLLCLVSCAHGAASRPRRAAFGWASLTTRLQSLTTSAVLAFAHALPGLAWRRWFRSDRSAARQLRGAWIDGNPLETRDGRISLSQQLGTACVEYETQFERSRFGLEDSSAVVLSQSQWLWRPEPFPAELEHLGSFRGPGRRTGVACHGHVPTAHTGRTATPSSSRRLVSLAPSTCKRSRLPELVSKSRVSEATPVDRDVRRWLESGGPDHCVGRSGDSPVTVFSSSSSPLMAQAPRSPSGWCDGAAARRFCCFRPSDARVVELEADWVAIHELSHLWLPRLHAKDRWLSEGIATYLQEVLRARCGLQSSDRAWSRIREGFERGRRSGTGQPLADESREHEPDWSLPTCVLGRHRLRAGNRPPASPPQQGREHAAHACSTTRSAIGEKRPGSVERVARSCGARTRQAGPTSSWRSAERYAASSDFPDTS